MAEKGDVYVLDEPTTGLHLADVENLLGLLDRLVDSGKSVLVIEHHQAVMAHADWIIDLGPGAGHDGGRIVFEGTPADLVAAEEDAHRRAPRGLRRARDRNASGLGRSEVAGDQHALHLGGALADLQDLRVALEAGDRELVHEAVAAVDLGGLPGVGHRDLASCRAWRSRPAA